MALVFLAQRQARRSIRGKFPSLCRMTNDKSNTRAFLSSEGAKLQRLRSPQEQCPHDVAREKAKRAVTRGKQKPSPYRIGSFPAYGCRPKQCSAEKSCAARPAKAPPSCARRIFSCAHTGHNRSGPNQSRNPLRQLRCAFGPPQPPCSRG